MAATADIKIDVRGLPEFRELLVKAFEAGFDDGHYTDGERRQCECRAAAVATFRSSLGPQTVRVGPDHG